MPIRRKVPFSGKAKKQQLKDKKQRQQPNFVSGNKNFLSLLVTNTNFEEEEFTVQSINQQPSNRNKNKNPNRYNLRFQRETQAEIQQKKEEARKTLKPVSQESLEINVESYFPKELDFPMRPPWDLTMSKEELDRRENRYFTEYVNNIEKNFDWSELSYFEMNLETWRQLWRVLEISDVVLLITDIRFPALMLPPSVYNYIINVLNKDLIVVLNKIDLAPAPLVVAWKNYLKSIYPELHIIMFTSYPSYNLRENSEKKGLQSIRRKGKMRMAAEGAQTLLEACQAIVKDQVDLSSWKKKISEEMTIENEIGDDEVEVGETITLKSQDTSYKLHKKYEGGVLTIGCIGQPNVGKSSLMNALMGKKVVSVSRTPGHTKHFQTIFLTNTVRLCDCPGLVFPSKVPKPLQVLMGSFPIAQLKDPSTCVKFLAERTDLVSLLQIKHPDEETDWSAIDICDGWAKKKGFLTARTGRPDTYRAANHLLRIALDGKIPFFLKPPNYSKSEEKWQVHTEVKTVEWIQAATKKFEHFCGESSEDLDSEEDEEGEEVACGGVIPNRSSKEISPDDGNDNTDEDDDDELGFVSTNKFQALNVCE